MSHQIDENTFLVTSDVTDADAGAATSRTGTAAGARTATILTTRGILRGVVATLFFALVVAVGFGVGGYIQDMAVGQRPINVVDREKCTCDCFDGAVVYT